MTLYSLANLKINFVE